MHTIQSRLKSQTLTNGFKTLLYFEPIATFMYYLFREDVEVDLLASKIAALFHLNSSAIEDEILIVQADIELKTILELTQRKSIQT